MITSGFFYIYIGIFYFLEFLLPYDSRNIEKIYKIGSDLGSNIVFVVERRSSLPISIVSDNECFVRNDMIRNHGLRS
jgi:hypothetical protein